MVTIRHDGQNMSVMFRQNLVGRLCETGFEDTVQTTCIIVGNDGKALALGLAHRSADDAEDLDFAMELSLSRAVKTLTTDKDLRVKFWNAFFTAQDAEKNYERQAIAEAHQQFDDQIAGLLGRLFPPPQIIDVTPPSVQDSPTTFAGNTIPWPQLRGNNSPQTAGYVKTVPWPDFDEEQAQAIQLPASPLTEQEQNDLAYLEGMTFCKGKCSVCDKDRQELATLRQKAS